MSCEKCDHGWEPVVDAQGIRRVRRCACWLAAHPSHVTGMPTFFEQATLANFARRDGLDAAKAAASRWLKGTHDLFLGGSVGSGKTRLACSLANEGVALGVSAAFFDVGDLLDRARKAEFQHETVIDPLLLARNVDVLILDDIGAMEKTSDYTLRTLLALYNNRLASQRRTIWTSNHTLDALGALLGDDRLPSRIAGAAELLWIAASDYRVDGPRAWAV